MRVVVHPDRCIAATQCTMIAPAVFGQRPEGGVLLLNAEPDASQELDVSDAEIACPMAAIELIV